MIRRSLCAVREEGRLTEKLSSVPFFLVRMVMEEFVNGGSGLQFSGDDRPCAVEDCATKEMEREGL